MSTPFTGCLAVLLCSGAALSGATINVPAGGDFQAALNSAQGGDVILLAAGATYTGPFVLPANSGAYITIRTSAPDSALPPPGSRIDPSYSSILPKLVGDGDRDLPIVSATPTSSHFQFIGVEITPTPGAALYQLVQLGTGSETSLDQLPGDFVFDRCYLHGDPAQGTRRGIAMNVPNVTVMNSYLSDFKIVNADSQALACWNGPGPLTITNNYLEGAAENILIGGQDPTIPNLVPTGITIRRNYFSKPLSWRVGDPAYQGTHWSVKNLLEFKNARQIVVDGNLFENNWADAQAGFAILFTPRNQEGTAPWSVVSDVQFTNNIVRHVASAVNVLGTDDIYISQQLHNITVKNNLFEDVGSSWGGTGRLFQMLNGALNVTFDHNTGFPEGAVLMADELPSPGLRFTNNLAAHGSYGFVGSDYAEGTSTLNYYFPGAVFQSNAIIGGTAHLYPPGNFFPSGIGDVGFVNPGDGVYSLLSSSPLHHAGTDGADVGVDMNALNAAQAGSVSSTVSVLTTPPVAGATVSAASFSTAANAPGSVVSLFGTALASSQVAAPSLPLPSSLNGTVVTINGIAAPLFYASPTQINYLLPARLTGLSEASLVVSVNGVASPAVTVSLFVDAPGIFSLNQQGTGQGAILISQTGEVAGAAGQNSRPVNRGEYVSIYCTGLGQVTNAPADGSPAQVNPQSNTMQVPTVVIGGVVAPAVQFSGLAPGFTGLYQVNVQVPSNASTGNAVAVSMRFNQGASNTVTIAVQ
jgi:uncharacterized protein (TIGR03437 family)